MNYRCEVCERSCLGELSKDPIEGDAVVCEYCGAILELPSKYYPDWDAILKDHKLDKEKS